MSSNSPVLLLAPSAVPTAPIMAPLLVTKSAELRARGLISTPSPFHMEKPTEPKTAPSAVMKPVSAPFAPAASSALVSSTVAELKPTVKAVAVVPPVAHVANAAPVVVARPTTSPVVPTPTLSTPPPTPAAVVDTPVEVAAAVATPSAAAVATSPLRPSVTVTPVLTRSSPLASIPATAPTSATSSPTPAPTMLPTKRAAAVAAAAAVSALPTTLTVSTASASPASSPKSASPSSPSSPKTSKSSTGRWTEAEHKLFLKGLEQFPYRAWKKIATLIKTRTVVQIRTHAQKYYQKLEKEEQRMREREAQLAAQQAPAAASTAASAAASVAAAALSSAVSTPRSTVPSAPSTPAAAASASFRELSLAAPLVTTPSAAAAAAAVPHFIADRDDVDLSFIGAAGKRKAPMRKRKSSADELSDPPSSLPKRMMKEKKFVREKTMSPKQKTVVSNGRAFGFGDAADASSGDDCAKGSNVRGLSGLKTHPLDFDDDDDVTSGSTAMILDFGEEKPMEYPFTLDTALERGLAAIDHDELLQLSDDDEDMEWFASATAGEDVDLLDGSTGEDADSTGSPLDLDGQAFSPLYSADALHFVSPSPAASECSTPSPILSSSADCSDFGLSDDDEVDDEEDFVLDPEKFLSTYFNPGADKDMDAAAL